MTMHTQDTNLHATGTAITGVSQDTWWITENVLVDSENGYGFRGTGDQCRLLNIGTIWSESDFGVRYEGTNGYVFNAVVGTIGGHGGISLSPGTQLVNTGKIISTGNGDAAAGIKVVAGADTSTRIENSGTVSGEFALLALARISLHNTGDVFGHIDLGNAPDVIHNAGTILGDVSLGGGADIYDGRGGLLQGAVYGGGGRDVLRGGSWDETLVGGRGNDKVNGGSGDDTIIGCYGKDLLKGGAGADTFGFVFPDKVDRIVDLSVAEDRIQLDREGFAGLGKKGVLSADAFHIGRGAADAGHRIVYNAETGVLKYDANGDGHGGVTKFAKLAPGLDLSHHHFDIV